MTTTVQAMEDARRKHLEAELVRVSQELAEHTHSPAYAIPYKNAAGRFVYVVVGTRNAVHGLISRMKTK